MEEEVLSNINEWMDDDGIDVNSTTSFLATTPPYGILTSTAELVHRAVPPSDIFRYFQLSFLTLVTVVGFVSNFLVLLLFYKRPTLRSFSNRFVLNLSISHFWQCILVLPTTVISIATDQWLLGNTFCIVSGFLFTTLNITSVLCLLLIALDRNCAVNSPLHYTMTITKTRTGILIFLTWVVGFLVASPPLYNITQIKYRENWHMCTIVWDMNDSYSVTYGSVLIVLGFMVPFLTTICVYSSMFQAAKDNSERARKHSVNSTIVENNIPDTQVKMGSVPVKKKFRRWSSGSNQFFGEEWKAVRTGFLVVMTFTLCWLPYFSVTSLEAYFDSDTTMPNYVSFIVVVCIFSACVINPYLYVFRNKTSRKNIKQLICHSNLAKNKKFVFQKQSKDKSAQTTQNACILAASLVNESSEKVKALPALYQDIDGRWQAYSTSEERSRDDLDETISNVSDEDFFDTGFQKISVPVHRKKYTQNSNVQAIYNNSFTHKTLAKSLSSGSQPSSGSSHLLLCRLKTSLNRDSTSSDTTENCSMSLESNNSNEQQLDTESSLPARRGIGKYLFNTSEELWDSKQGISCHKKIESVAEEPTPTTNTRKTLSSFGRARRKSFIHSHMKNKKSNETTLTSSTKSESLDSSSVTSTNKSSKGNRPKLVRQMETIEPPDDSMES